MITIPVWIFVLLIVIAAGGVVFFAVVVFALIKLIIDVTRNW